MKVTWRSSDELETGTARFQSSPTNIEFINFRLTAQNTIATKKQTG